MLSLHQNACSHGFLDTKQNQDCDVKYTCWMKPASSCCSFNAGHMSLGLRQYVSGPYALVYNLRTEELSE